MTEQATDNTSATDPTVEVTVYSTALCSPCEHLKSHLTESGVAFVVKDPMMDEEAAEFLEDRNIRSTPVLTVGDHVVIGFDRAKIDEALRSSGVSA